MSSTTDGLCFIFQVIRYFGTIEVRPYHLIDSEYKIPSTSYLFMLLSLDDSGLNGHWLSVPAALFQWKGQFLITKLNNASLLSLCIYNVHNSLSCT